MTRRERLMATLEGKPVDRPAVNFYEIGGLAFNPDDPEPFNVFNHPSWRPLFELAENETDLIRLRTPIYRDKPGNPRDKYIKVETYLEGGSRFERTRIEVDGRTLTQLTRRDPDVETIWTIEHLLKDAEDARAWLQLPDEIFDQEIAVEHIFAEEATLGDKGIVMVDTADPVCIAASQFSMQDYTIIAYSERELFHAMLQKIANYMQPQTEEVARKCPGRLWRIFGPEYACEPYLPPQLFDEYVVRYTGPMVQAVRATGGYPRIHCHGRISKALPKIVAMGATGIDPIEPPLQGDVDLRWVRQEFGKDLVLFGNLEVTDLENLAPHDFERVVAKSIADGTAGEGRGFVLMPTAAPYGRILSPRTVENYRTMVRLIKAW
jgi:hypothetical protein